MAAPFKCWVFPNALHKILLYSKIVKNVTPLLQMLTGSEIMICFLNVVLWLHSMFRKECSKGIPKHIIGCTVCITGNKIELKKN
jgi:hypothetical protein